MAASILFSAFVTFHILHSIYSFCFAYCRHRITKRKLLHWIIMRNRFGDPHIVGTEIYLTKRGHLLPTQKSNDIFETVHYFKYRQFFLLNTIITNTPTTATTTMITMLSNLHYLPNHLLPPHPPFCSYQLPSFYHYYSRHCCYRHHHLHNHQRTKRITIDGPWIFFSWLLLSWIPCHYATFIR